MQPSPSARCGSSRPPVTLLVALALVLLGLDSAAAGSLRVDEDGVYDGVYDFVYKSGEKALGLPRAVPPTERFMVTGTYNNLKDQRLSLLRSMVKAKELGLTFVLPSWQLECEHSMSCRAVGHGMGAGGGAAGSIRTACMRTRRNASLGGSVLQRMCAAGMDATKWPWACVLNANGLVHYVALHESPPPQKSGPHVACVVAVGECSVQVGIAHAWITLAGSWTPMQSTLAEWRT